MHKNLRRSVVALATAFACLAVMASPASAVSHSATITGGTIGLANTGGTFSLNAAPGGGGAGCGTTLVADSNATAGTISLSNYAGASRFSSGTAAYISNITSNPTTSTTGTLSSWVIDWVIWTWLFTIRSALNGAPSTDCATTGTALCTLRATPTLAGTYTAAGTPFAVGDTFTVGTSTGATLTQQFGTTCSAPFSSLVGGPLSVTGLTGVFTT